MIFKKKKRNKIGTSTGFEPMGSALTLQIFLYNNATIQRSYNNFVGIETLGVAVSIFFPDAFGDVHTKPGSFLGRL